VRQQFFGKSNVVDSPVERFTREYIVWEYGGFEDPDLNGSQVAISRLEAPA